MEVIIKPTNACNGNCVYCSADASPDRHGRLGMDGLKVVFSSFKSYLEAHEGRTVRFIWHGGEPMMMGRAYYEELLNLQYTIFGNLFHRVRNQMQSNLTLLNEKWIPVLREMHRGTGIGTSFDIIDGVRGIEGGGSLNEKWVRSVMMLQEAGIPIGFIYVAHGRVLDRPAELYHYFKNLSPSANLRINPLYLQGRAKTSFLNSMQITPRQYGEFMARIFDIWREDFYRLSLNPLQEWLGALKGSRANLCCDSSGRCAETHLGIDPEGNVYNCGRFADSEEFKLGSIFEDDLESLMQHPVKQELRNRSETLMRSTCGDCRWWDLCHGGCPLVSHLYAECLDAPTHWCEARKIIFEKIAAAIGEDASEPYALACHN